MTERVPQAIRDRLRKLLDEHALSATVRILTPTLAAMLDALDNADRIEAAARALIEANRTTPVVGANALLRALDGEA